MPPNDVQVKVIGRLTAQLDGLGVKIVRMETKAPAGRRVTKGKPVASVEPAIAEASEIVVFEH